MLVSFEGLSKSGKTTIYNRIVERNPSFVEIVGPRMPDVGMRDWDEYQKWEHAIKKPIYDANPETTFIANRAFSEAVYATDEATRQWMLRMYGAYDDAFIVFVHANREMLKERGSHDAAQYKTLVKRYNQLAGQMDHVMISTTDQTVQESVQEVEEALDEL